MKLSIVMPCFNEQDTVTGIVHKVLEQPFDLEIIIVDDNSTDGTREILSKLKDEHEEVRLILKPKNEGKGSALRQGFKIATGDVIVIQDADFEYDPDDYSVLLKPILTGKADAVFGSRFLSAPHRVFRFWHLQYPANKLLTFLCNMVSDLRLTDMETCYKAFRRDVIQPIELKENRFGIEPEMTIKIARIPEVRIYEVGISYHGRTYAEGKKIRLKDLFEAIYVIAKYGFAK